MNLPVGEIVEQGLDLSELAVRELLESFVGRGFSGYIVNTVSGHSGVEEGLLLFRQGVLAGSFFEYMSNGSTFFGDYSLQHVFNSFAAEKGVVDIVSLSMQQVDLITAFNEKLKVSVEFSKKTFSKYFVKTYSTEFALQAMDSDKESKPDTKSIFKKLGLADLGE